MTVNEKAQCLIGVGASLAAACEPCLNACIALARKCGADDQEIEAAMAIARRVMRCASRSERPARPASNAEDGPGACCGSTEITS